VITPIADLNHRDLAALRLPMREFSADMLLVLHVPSLGLHTSAFCIPKDRCLI